jgi:hypothetical protein
MIDEVELRRMSPQERARLARALVALDARGGDSDPVSQRRRRLLIAAAIGCSLVLAAWIGVLEVTLPRHYQAGGWRAAWVGFDGALLLVFLATAWAAWQRRQVLIVCLVVLATLLCCDAWFDTALDWGTRNFLISLLSAVVVELPLALVALMGARRLLRLTLRRLEVLEGVVGPVPAFWRVPLFGDTAAGYRDILPPAALRVAGLPCDPASAPCDPAPLDGEDIAGVAGERAAVPGEQATA